MRSTLISLRPTHVAAQLPERCGRVRVQRCVQKDPRGRRGPGQSSGLGFGATCSGEGTCRGRGDRRQRCAGPVYHRNRNGTHDAPPSLPPMKRCQIVGAHQPDEADGGITSRQIPDRICGVAHPRRGFEGGDDHPGMIGKPFSEPDPLQEGKQFLVGLQGIAGCHHPPDAIYAESAKRGVGHCAMPRMRWIERSAEQGDPLAEPGPRWLQI